MASVLLMLSLRPRLLLIPTFCMEDMEVMVILDMLDMEDMVSMVLDIVDIEDMPDTHMVDMPTTDKLTEQQQHQNGPCIVQPSLFSLSVTTIFQCLIPLWWRIAGNNERKIQKCVIKIPSAQLFYISKFVTEQYYYNKNA